MQYTLGGVKSLILGNQPFKLVHRGIKSPNLHHEIKCCYVAVKNSNITDLRANFF